MSCGSFGNTIFLSILNKLSSPSWLSFMGDCHLRRFLKLYYVTVFWNFLITSLTGSTALGTSLIDSATPGITGSSSYTSSS
jgi:hypothetical protein